jgi:2-polyprenyl-3-methyl-5-hydroxy-6-metoxy-1,4-benzoquinol methylase
MTSDAPEGHDHSAVRVPTDDAGAGGQQLTTRARLSAALCLFTDRSHVRGDVIARNAAKIDLLLLVCWPEASDTLHQAVEPCHAQDLPVLVFDVPEWMSASQAFAVTIANAERFFAIDRVVLLAPSEVMVEPRPGPRTRPAGSALHADVPVSSVVGRSRWRRPSAQRSPDSRSPRLAPIVSTGRAPRDYEAWLQSLDRESWAGIDAGPDRRTWSQTLRPGRSRVIDRFRRRLHRGQAAATTMSIPRAAEPVEPPSNVSTTATAPGAGIWSAQFHRSNLYLDIPPFRFVIERHRPTSVLDIGCGVGGYVALCARLGVRDLLGVDGFEPSRDLLCTADQYRQHDLRQRLDLSRRFDLVVSAEVAEHLEEQHEETFLQNVTRHARRLILFSAARPGQRGHGHVNLKPAEHWLEIFRSQGWVPHHYDTCAVRSLSTFHWFRRNLVLLAHERSITDLSRRFRDSPAGQMEIEAPWIGQGPAVCERSFTSPLPLLGDG